MKTHTIKFTSPKGHPATGEFVGTMIRERATTEVVHLHDDSHDPDRFERPFSAICGNCGKQTNQIGIVRVWTDRQSIWENHPNRCMK